MVLTWPRMCTPGSTYPPKIPAAPATRQRIQRIVLVIAFAGVCLGLWRFASLFTWTWRHYAVIWGDVDDYFAVGQGMLNGWRPYLDLLEIKPPGIFVLSALSLHWSGGSLLYFVGSAAAVFGIPVLLCLWGWRQGKTPIALLALLFGLGIAMHTMVQGGFGQPELFGVFFGVLFFTTTAFRGTPAYVLSVLAAMGAIGMKEPFLLALIAGGLLFADDRRSFVRRCAVPIVLALGLGTLILLLSGSLGPYVNVYLPELFAGRMARLAVYHLTGQDATVSGPNPLWLRALPTRRLYSADAWESPVPLVLYSIMGMLVTLPGIAAQRLATAGIATVAAGAGIYLLHRIYLLMQILFVAAASSIAVTPSSLFVLFWQDILVLAAIVAASRWLLRTDTRALLWIVRLLAGFALATLAVGSADNYQAHHFLFATPFYVAGFLRFASAKSGRLLHAVLAVSLTLAIAFSPSENYLRKRDAAAPDLDSLRATQFAADALDSLMDSCSMERYLPWIDNLGVMRHSPYLQIYPIYRAFDETKVFDGRPSPTFRQAYLDALRQAPLFVLTNLNVPMNGEVRAVLDRQFSSTPPPCAAGFVPAIPFELYFRR